MIVLFFFSFFFFFFFFEIRGFLCLPFSGLSKDKKCDTQVFISVKYVCAYTMQKYKQLNEI